MHDYAIKKKHFDVMTYIQPHLLNFGIFFFFLKKRNWKSKVTKSKLVISRAGIDNTFKLYMIKD
jgi:hypothetical protein